MLLFVVQAKRHKIGHMRSGFREKRRHVLVDMPSVFKDLLHSRPAQVAAMVAKRAVPDRVVIAVKKKAEILVEDLVTRREFFEDHFLKEPCRMSDVPLDGRDVDDRLRDEILDLKRLAEMLCKCAHFAIELTQVRLTARFWAGLHLTD